MRDVVEDDAKIPDIIDAIGAGEAAARAVIPEWRIFGEGGGLGEVEARGLGEGGDEMLLARSSHQP